MIPVNEPLISKNAEKYVLDCLKTGWVSSAGKYINQFENQFSSYIGTKFGVTTTSGTTALHLALVSAGIGPGDEVIIPDLTIISCALAVIYVGAKPILVDVEDSTGNIDSGQIKEKITKRTKAIMVVHLYGHPANLDPILKIAEKHKLLIIEDAAEAHGAEVKINGTWRKAGSIGDMSCFSFYGNKIITTGEGGMLLTNNKKFYEKASLLKDLAHIPGKRFYHEKLGYNFRMTNLQAALGLAQMEEIDNYLTKKRWMAKLYSESLNDVEFLEFPKEESYAKSVFWMYTPLVKKNSKITRGKFCEELKKLGIDTRTYFIPLHSQPVLKRYGFKNRDFPISTDLAQRGFYLPSGLAITEKQIKKVVDSIKEIASRFRHGKIKPEIQN